MTLDEANEAAYAWGREMEERVAAKLATDPAIRDLHFMMAERYADRASSIEEGGGLVP